MELTSNILMGKFSDYKAVKCTVIGCRNKSHIEEIEKMYQLIVNSVDAGSRQFAKEKKRKNKFKVIPGWNRNVKHLHCKSRDHYLKWLRSGRQRDSIEFHDMHESRKIFKKALNDCKVNEFAEICTSIEEKFKSKDMASFWKEVKNKKNNAKKSCIIDGKNESVNILDIFTNKFMGDGHQEANSNRDESQLIANIKIICQNSRKFHLRISASTIRKLCKELKSGIGHDGIHSAFLMNVSDTFLDNIAHFINSCYNHCFFPSNVLKGDINPTIKDQKGNVIECSNYRSLMLILEKKV